MSPKISVMSQVFWAGGAGVGDGGAGVGDGGAGVGDGGAGVGEGGDGVGDGDGVPVEVIVKTTASLARKHVPLFTLPYPLSPQIVPHEFLINQ